MGLAGIGAGNDLGRCIPDAYTYNFPQSVDSCSSLANIPIKRGVLGVPLNSRGYRGHAAERIVNVA